jgi:hypothetical protein
MANEPSTEAKTKKKGYVAKQVGGLAMVVGVIVAVMSGSFSFPAAVLFFGGLIALIVGVAQRDTDNA